MRMRGARWLALPAPGAPAAARGDGNNIENIGSATTLLPMKFASLAAISLVL